MALRVSARSTILTLSLVATLVANDAVNAQVSTGGEWDEKMSYTCANGEYFTSLSSEHSNKYQDRKWSFTCGAPASGPAPSIHYWTIYYVNEYDGFFNFLCPKDYALTGWSSEHSNRYEDRRFKFQCSLDPDFELEDCSNTYYINRLDGGLSYQVPVGSVVTGVRSFHNNGAEDRRFWFTVCKYTKKGSAK